MAFLQRGDFQPRIDELIGEQRVVLVGVLRLQLDGAGGGVYLVIQAEQIALRQQGLVGAPPRLRR